MEEYDGENILDLFRVEGRQERAEWYLSALERHTGGEAEPASGGSETRYLANEVGSAYVNELYLAVILLCAALVEQEINAELVNQDILCSNEDKNLPSLANIAKKEDLLNSREVDLVLELNTDRVSFFHYRDFERDDSPLKDVFQSQKEPYRPYDEYGKRAQQAITTWLTIAIKAWTEWPNYPKSCS